MTIPRWLSLTLPRMMMCAPCSCLAKAKYRVFQVSWSKKMNFDVGCPMKFNHFPFE